MTGQAGSNSAGFAACGPKYATAPAMRPSLERDDQLAALAKICHRADESREGGPILVLAAILLERRERDGVDRRRVVGREVPDGQIGSRGGTARESCERARPSASSDRGAPPPRAREGPRMARTFGRRSEVRRCRPGVPPRRAEVVARGFGFAFALTFAGPRRRAGFAARGFGAAFGVFFAGAFFAAAPARGFLRGLAGGGFALLALRSCCHPGCRLRPNRTDDR